jgi:uncharacterized protein
MWGIGQKDLDNGVLLLIAEKERKVRIEVGYGLESSLTDLKAQRIIRNVIVPQFKIGQLDQGVIAGVDAIIGTIRGQFQDRHKTEEATQERFPLPLGIIGLVVFIILLVVMLKNNFFSAAAAGGIIVPAAGAICFDLRMLYILGLIPVGFFAVLLLSLTGRLFKPKSRYAAFRINWDDDDRDGGSSSDGSSSNNDGSSSGGGFSGGGGSSGGGGASGGW